jgi:hypothetical protein
MTPAGRGRIRNVRIALSWVVIVSLYMAFRLPLLAPATMSVAEWVSVTILAGYVAAAVYGIVRIERAPRDVVSALSAAIVVALLSLVNFARVIVAQASGSGPAAVLPMLVALGTVLGIFIALIGSWRVHFDVHDHAT